MSDYKFRPESIVIQIRNNLQDRYESGYPILKELLQNADDAGAHRFRLDARKGWPDAENPLLRRPGLLIVNDGEFRPEDREGILSFGESVKADDDATIGKFGFGQKAVFHLCDAFAVHAFGREEPFSDVVNPFEDVDVAGNVTGDWRKPHRIRRASSAGCGGRFPRSRPHPVVAVASGRSAPRPGRRILQQPAHDRGNGRAGGQARRSSIPPDDAPSPAGRRDPGKRRNAPLNPGARRGSTAGTEGPA